MIKVDHVTMVVKNLDEAIKSFEKILHITPWRNGIIDNPPECRLVVLNTPGGARIELVEPNLAVASPFSRFLKERGEGVFGLSIFADDFDAEIKSLKAKGIPVKVDTQSVLFPENPFRMGWLSAEAGHGVAIEFVDTKALPSFERNWETEG